MKRFEQSLFFAFLISGLFFSSFNVRAQNTNYDDVFAWCIVPFDKLERTPEQRIKMLADLGLSAYAYDWRSSHLPEMEKEILLARENEIQVNAVWMWIDNNNSVGNLSSDNKRVLEIIKKTKLNTQLWISFPENYFDGLTEKECFDKSVSIINYLLDELRGTNCKIGLYNHGGWFGDPVNLVKIIKLLPSQQAGIIFNFHHAHNLLENYEAMVKQIAPFLWAVNLNGMDLNGPKILPLGKGLHEKIMIDVLRKNGFSGPWGILGHRTDEDVKIVLMENLKGYDLLFSR